MSVLITSVTFIDPGDSTGMINASLSSIQNLPDIEVCAFGGPNCSGGGSGGILPGASDTFAVALAKGSIWASTSAVSVSPLGFKYQTGIGSFEFSGSGASLITGRSDVPEPGSMALIGLGLAALALSRGRKS
jgi:hypothetical protein